MSTSTHPRARRRAPFCRVATLVGAIVALLGAWAPPVAADETDGLHALINVICTDLPQPESVQVWFEVHNTTPDPREPVLEVSSLPDQVLTLGAGTPSQPGFAGGYTTLTPQQAGDAVTVGMRAGAGQAYLAGPITMPNPCVTPPLEGFIEITCDPDGWPIELRATVVNNLSAPQTVQVEMSDRSEPVPPVVIPPSIVHWIHTGWTLDEGGPVLTAALRHVESGAYVVEPTQVANPCQHLVPSPPTTHPSPPTTQPVPPTSPSATPDAPTSPGSPAAEPTGAGHEPSPAEAMAASVRWAEVDRLDTLPRTGTSSVVLATVSALVLLGGVVLTRAANDQLGT
jgi:hypothetical protein